MTREEAQISLAKLKRYISGGGVIDRKANEALDMAIDALSREPSEDVISRRWLMECANEGWIKFDTEKDANTYIHLVRDIAPSAQPEPCDDPRADIYYLAEKIGIHRLYALVVELRGEPEPCKDAVSREAVSKWLKQYGQDVLHGKYKFSLMYIWKNLMDLPSAQPEQRWIPVSERLPKVDESVLATTVWNDITTAWRIGGDKWFIHDGGTNATTEDLIAWMPLPDCYRGG